MYNDILGLVTYYAVIGNLLFQHNGHRIVKVLSGDNWFFRFVDRGVLRLIREGYESIDEVPIKLKLMLRQYLLGNMTILAAFLIMYVVIYVNSKTAWVPLVIVAVLYVFTTLPSRIIGTRMAVVYRYIWALTAIDDRNQPSDRSVIARRLTRLANALERYYRYYTHAGDPITRTMLMAIGRGMAHSINDAKRSLMLSSNRQPEVGRTLLTVGLVIADDDGATDKMYRRGIEVQPVSDNTKWLTRVGALFLAACIAGWVVALAITKIDPLNGALQVIGPVLLFPAMIALFKRGWLSDNNKNARVAESPNRPTDAALPTEPSSYLP